MSNIRLPQTEDRVIYLSPPNGEPLFARVLRVDEGDPLRVWLVVEAPAPIPMKEATPYGDSPGCWMWPAWAYGAALRRLLGAGRRQEETQHLASLH